MNTAWLAELLVVLHLAFVGFAVFGGLLALHSPRWTLLHLPALGWAAYVELSGGICPLTPWEQRLRAAAGQGGYEGGFVEHYLVPVLYPPGLGPSQQWWLGVGLVLFNLGVYLYVWRRRRGSAAQRRSP